jgi:hypothetical protein
LKTSSLPLFSSVSLFILIDAGKNDGVSAVAHAGIGIPPPSPGRRQASDGTLARESMSQYTKPPVPKLFGTGELISWLNQQA